jgi:hypothetical protein
LGYASCVSDATQGAEFGDGRSLLGRGQAAESRTSTIAAPYPPTFAFSATFPSIGPACGAKFWGECIGLGIRHGHELME